MRMDQLKMFEAAFSPDVSGTKQACHGLVSSRYRRSSYIVNNINRRASSVASTELFWLACTPAYLQQYCLYISTQLVQYTRVPFEVDLKSRMCHKFNWGGIMIRRPCLLRILMCTAVRQDEARRGVLDFFIVRGNVNIIACIYLLVNTADTHISSNAPGLS